MKKTYKLAIAVATTAMTVGVAGSALAFHDGGVARCNGCHTMHNSELNAPINTIASLPTQFTTGPMLLRAPERSSACLNCHGEGTDNHSYHVYTEGSDTNPAQVPEQYGPGGDFAWLVIGTSPTPSDRHGHNINAQEFGLDMDATLTASPGGTYPADSLACSSCHDPHGKYRVIGGTTTQVTTGAPIVESGSYGADPATLPADEAIGVYRFLGGVGYNQKSTATTADPFVNAAPIAVAPGTYNVAGGGSGGVRVAYGSGMAEWCANCHAGIHNDDYPTNLRHPAGNNAKLGTVIAGNYNAYVSSGINTGDQSTSYLALVPFETGKDYTDVPGLVAEQASTAGPDSTANVMCLSCHRAHASGFNSMLRWNYDGSPFLVNASGEWVGQGIYYTQEQTNASYYNKPASDFGAYQRNLCNKCHAKD